MLLNYTHKTCTVTIDSFHWPRFLEEMEKAGYRGVLAGFKSDILDRFHVRPETGGAWVYPSKRARFAEIFFPDPSTTLFLKVARSFAGTEEQEHEDDDDVWSDPGAKEASKILLYQIDAAEIIPLDAPENRQLEELIAAANLALEALGVSGKSITWKAEADEGSAPPFPFEAGVIPDNRSMELATVFRDGRLTGLLERLAADRSFTIEDFLASVSNREETEYYIDKLFEMDFLTEEIVVYSRTTGAAVIRAKDRAALKTLSDMGVTSAEGKPLEEEDVRRLITLPPGNQPLVSGTWAARTFLLNVLSKMGYGASDIHVSRNEGALDIVHVHCGPRGVVFALAPAEFTEKSSKELWKAIGKSPHFRLFIFGARGVEEAAYQALSTLSGPNNVFVLTGLEDFSSTVVDAINRERTANIRELLAELNSQLTVDVASLVTARGA